MATLLTFVVLKQQTKAKKKQHTTCIKLVCLMLWAEMHTGMVTKPFSSFTSTQILYFQVADTTWSRNNP